MFQIVQLSLFGFVKDIVVEPFFTRFLSWKVFRHAANVHVDVLFVGDAKVLETNVLIMIDKSLGDNVYFLDEIVRVWIDGL